MGRHQGKVLVSSPALQRSSSLSSISRASNWIWKSGKEYYSGPATAVLRHYFDLLTLDPQGLLFRPSNPEKVHRTLVEHDHGFILYKRPGLIPVGKQRRDYSLWSAAGNSLGAYLAAINAIPQDSRTLEALLEVPPAIAMGCSHRLQAHLGYHKELHEAITALR